LSTPVLVIYPQEKYTHTQTHTQGDEKKGHGQIGSLKKEESQATLRKSKHLKRHESQTTAGLVCSMIRHTDQKNLPLLPSSPPSSHTHVQTQTHTHTHTNKKRPPPQNKSSIE
jgi:hypothetical protein